MKTINSIVFFIFLSALFSFTTKNKEAVYITDDIYRFHLGDWECTVINEGEMAMPLSTVFNSENANILKPVIDAFKIDTTSVHLGINILILKNKDQLILIDPGIGKPMGPKTGQLMEKMKTAKIDASEVDYVIISHGHYDHIGGIASAEGSLYFPNAKYVISETEWKFWTNFDNLKNFPEYWEQFAREDLPPIKDKLMLVQGSKEIVPGVTVRQANGHTPGQISILISSKNETLLYLADVILAAFQVGVPDASPIFDMDPEMAAKTRKEIIDEAYKNKTTVFGYHFEFPGVGTINKGEQFEYVFNRM